MAGGNGPIHTDAMKRTEPQTIRQIIDRVLDASAGRTSVLEHRAAALWADTMGPTITRHTIRRYVAKGVLHVYLDSAPLKSELEFQKSHIVQAINTALGSDALTSLQIH